MDCSENYKIFIHDISVDLIYFDFNVKKHTNSKFYIEIKNASTFFSSYVLIIYLYFVFHIFLCGLKKIVETKILSLYVFTSHHKSRLGIIEAIQ